VRSAIVIAIWVTSLSLVPAAQAQPARPGNAADSKVKPWARGVSPAKQQRAMQLFREGNEFLEQSKYTEAAPKYELALAAWDHPSIRFNMAFCLMNMRQPLAAWEHLQQALRFGDAPLGKEHYSQAMTYVSLLEGSLAELAVKSTEPEVNIMVDGVQILSGAGTHTMKLLAGKHQLVASRPGYITESRALDLAAGKADTEEIALKPEKVKLQVERENYERRWPWWVPWSVTGSSVVVGLAGTAVYLSARASMQRFDRDYANVCGSGCNEIPADLANRKTAAEHSGAVGIGLWSIAGAVAVTGGVMAILNRPRKQELRPVPALTVSRDYVGVGLSLALE
jgi:hypothetical protein